MSEIRELEREACYRTVLGRAQAISGDHESARRLQAEAGELHARVAREWAGKAIRWAGVAALLVVGVAVLVVVVWWR